MIHPFPSKKLTEERDRLILKTGLYRNISFIIISIILLISLILNFDPAKDFTDKRLPGTLLVILLIIITAILSLLRWELIIDKGNQSIVIHYRILSKQFIRENFPFKRLLAVQIRQIAPGNIPKYSVYQLFLIIQCPKSENGKRGIMIYSNTNRSEIENIGKRIAAFTNSQYLVDNDKPLDTEKI